MSFGHFYIQVCEKLIKQHGWGAPSIHLSTRPNLLDIIFAQYTGCTRLVDLLDENLIIQTAFLVNKEEAEDHVE